MRERCMQCPSLIPASRMAKHLELKHNQESKDNLSEDSNVEVEERCNSAEDELKSDLVEEPTLEIESTDKQTHEDADDGIPDSLVDEYEPSALIRVKDNDVDEPSAVDSDIIDSVSDEEDEIKPMGHSKRKRAIIDDDDEDDTESPSKKSNSPVKEERKEEEIDNKILADSEGLSSCSYCSAKVPSVELKYHMSKEHAWLDAEIDDNVTYGGSDLGEVDYDDVEVDYDEEGDDFFEDGNLAQMPAAALQAVVNPILFATEDCDFCEETVLKSSMNEHLLKQHDINMMEEDTPATETPKLLDSEVSSCLVCKVSLAVSIMPIHMSYYHAEVVDKDKEAEKPREEVKEDEMVSVGEQCEMCEERMPTFKMVAHLSEAHDIKVIEEKLDDSSQVDTSTNESIGTEDPFSIPDFLREKPKRPKFKCHHCQKKFSTREKVDLHVAKRHEGRWRCQVCITYRLVQENRYIGIMKQLTKTAKGIRESAMIPVNDNIQTGQEAEIIYNYEDLYPEEDFEECEECEDEFYWRSKEHSCDLSQANVRIVSGQKFKWADPEEADDEREDGEEVFEYITNRLAKSFVDKASRATSTAYVRDVVNDIVNNALDGKVFNPSKNSDPPISHYLRQKQLKEDQSLQLKSQILAYRYLKRKDPVPNIVERAASYENFRDCPANEIRKLGDYFYKEYKEDIENEEKENYKKKDEDKKRLQEETLREMTTAKLYDYSKYFIPTIKPPKKQKKIQFKPERRTPLLDSMMNNSMDNTGFKLPSGSALQMNDRNYLNKLKQHQEKTVKKLNMMQGNDRNSKQYQDTMRELMVDNRRLENLNKAPSQMNPFRQNPVKQEPGIKLEPGNFGRPAQELGNMPGISVKRMQPPQPPKLEIKKETTSPALQRLQSLGLSISVGQNGQSRPLEPAKPKVEPGLLNRTYPGPAQPKPEPVLNNSVLEQYRQLAGLKKQPEQQIPARPQPQSLWNASAKGREPSQPARNQMPPPRPLVRDQQSLLRAQTPQSRGAPPRDLQQPVRNNLPQSREPFQSLGSRFSSQNRQPQNSLLNREPIREAFKKPAPRTYEPQRPSPQNMHPKSYPTKQSRPVPPRPVSVPKAEYTDSQKLQLKSQILAYRMVSRKEKLPQIVRIAASNTNLKSMNIPKNEMRSLSNFFRQEYSAIA